jgi:4-hydroxyproline epimerase
MVNNTFYCIDGHTCGNPVRLVAGGGPVLPHVTMKERRQIFLRDFDWVRKGLMFEPRGHDMMSGSILYPPHDPANDIGILFIETSGCLPMCGHGTIGTVTSMIEKGLVTPKIPGKLRLEVPAGLVLAEYKMEDHKVKSVKITNVPSYLDRENIEIDVPEMGRIVADVAYGGNFYAIIDPQENFKGLEYFSAAEIIRFSPVVRELIREKHEFIHPLDNTIQGLSHVMWTGKPLSPESTARGAVFYGDKAIDRSPCGTGSSARMAQWFSKGKLKQGEPFIHESIIGSTFNCSIAGVTELSGRKAIIPSIEGWAKVTGHSTITIDENDDPFAFGFTVT